ncbi:helix-turn-helix domain-containing protein [Pedobacter sp. SD-b]|uniref:Helix-turn-helix domain-containing protein n=1 Tax=Pedobacter segetis TaxID=2793069 RepID=A0ABS1BL35_9SPHI|nr:helix-turn-helix domain-containing protein [Pedobacter segetis]
MYRHGNRNLTKADLIQFKSELLSEIKTIITPNQTTQSVWLKSSEVCKLLSISQGTLQNLRISGTIQYSKIGDTLFYKTEDINKLMEGGNEN